VLRASLGPVLALVTMAGVFALAKYRLGLHVAFALMLAAVAVPLVSGFGFPLSQLVEGTFGYFYLILILCSGLVFFGLLKEAGALEVITRDLVRLFGGRPRAFLCLLTLLLMLPGMFTGFGGVAVLTAGVLAGPILLRLGVPRPEAAAIVALASMFGMVAPPVNFPALLIVDGINMPYAGFGGILSLLSFPLALFSTLYLGARHARPIAPADRAALLAGSATSASARVAAYGPLVLVALLVVLIRAFPRVVPDLSTPLILVLGAGLTAAARPRTARFFRASAEALRGSGLHLVGVLLAVGMVMQMLTLSGIRGLLVVATLSLAGSLVLISTVVALPLLGGVLTALGVSTVVAVPLALGFVDKDMIVTVAGLSLIASLAEFTPPTAISGVLAAHVLGGESFGAVWRRALVPMAVTAVVGVLTIALANPIARVLAVGR